MYSEKFSLLCEEVGLAIKESKNEEGWVASFGGVEIVIEKMVIRLVQQKLQHARSIIQRTIKAISLSLLNLQQITGYLNFVTIVVPLSRTFLRRMYNIQLYFPPHGQKLRHRISSEAQKNLNWWLKVPKTSLEQSIRREARRRVRM